HLLGRRTVAIVGARNASANGRRMAETLAAGIGSQGIVVASGMARGIDAMAHAGALDSGTVAVMAGGVDVVYPAENAALYEEIVERGAVISEQPVGLTPKARHFPYRNRLISGLSLGVVVIEATFRSGSLITARFAGDQGREVMAVPGSPLDPRAKGSNQLIRDGAALVQTADDVIEAISGAFRPGAGEGRESAFAPPSTPVHPSDSELSAARADIAEKLGPDPVTVDEIIRQCQLSPAVVSTVLLEMELAGRLERHPGNQVALHYD
ncbi:MAG: DNA-protecting protein DprA, partial [Proteobacteria bacterium]|nr:DNA-protecting protein DprA [Pseudomonadota bacterium]